MSNACKRVATFYALTFLLLLPIPVIYGLTVGGPMDLDAAGARASGNTGLAWTSNLLVVIRLCVAEPILWLVVFGSAVPSLAALLLRAQKKSGIRALLGRDRYFPDPSTGMRAESSARGSSAHC